MLVGVPIITYVVVVIVGVGKEQVVLGKNIAAAQIYVGQMDLLWLLGRQNVLFLIGKASPGLISEVQAGLPVADDLGGLFDVDGTVVRGHYEFHAQALGLLDDLQKRGVH